MPRCHARAHRTGQQCRKHARTGYQVCSMHGAGTQTRPGGRPVTHGAYSRFLQGDEVVDFEYFRHHCSLDDDLAFASTKILHAVDQVDPQQLPSLLEVPSKIALRRKQVLEGLTLTLDLDVHFLQGFVEKVLTYVRHPAHRADLLAYLHEHVGEAALTDLRRAPADA